MVPVMFSGPSITPKYNGANILNTAKFEIDLCSWAKV